MADGPATPILLPPEESAAQADLRYVQDSDPGYTRRRRGRGFTYLDDSGALIPKGTPERLRLEGLAIPPAWVDVWICPVAHGHILATGRDAAGRKQYIYHPRWRAVRDGVKFHRMVLFGEALPKLRLEIAKALEGEGLDRRRVTAAVVRLIDVSLIRVGNSQYAQRNKHFGATTLRKKHVGVGGGEVEFEFTGKAGKERAFTIEDPALVEVIQQCEELPGYLLFQYFDDEGARQSIESGDVNAFLQEVTGYPISAKDFRTWAGTVLTYISLREFRSYSDEREAQKNITEAIKRVAKHLGNTPAVARSAYIHPDLIDAYLTGELRRLLEVAIDETLDDDSLDLDPYERAVLTFLKERVGDADG